MLQGVKKGNLSNHTSHADEWEQLVGGANRPGMTRNVNECLQEAVIFRNASRERLSTGTSAHNVPETVDEKTQ
jgi:hypothetical protein